jgi:hypothetical protein
MTKEDQMQCPMCQQQTKPRVVKAILIERQGRVPIRKELRVACPICRGIFILKGIVKGARWVWAVGREVTV